MHDLTEFERAAVAALTLWESRVCERGGAFDKSTRFYDLFFDCMENLQIAAEVDPRIRGAFASMSPGLDIKPVEVTATVPPETETE